jgi:hypothetical protein
MPHVAPMLLLNISGWGLGQMFLLHVYIFRVKEYFHLQDRRVKYCDVHAVGLRSGRYLVTARPLNNVKAAFSMWSDPRLY